MDFRLASHSSYRCSCCGTSISKGDIVWALPNQYICAECIRQVSTDFNQWYDSQERIDLEQEHQGKVNEKGLLRDVYKHVVKRLKKSLKNLPIFSEYIPSSFHQGTVIYIKSDVNDITGNILPPYKKLEFIYAAIYIPMECTSIYCMKPHVSLVHAKTIDGKPKRGVSCPSNIAYAAKDPNSWVRVNDLEEFTVLDLANPECFNQAVTYLEHHSATFQQEILNKNRQCECGSALCTLK